MKIKKLWLAVFLRVAVIFICTMAVILVANNTLLERYYTRAEKKLLIKQMRTVETVDIENRTETAKVLSDISEKHNLEIEIFDSNDTVLYTTQGGKLFDYLQQPSHRVEMSRLPLEVISQTVYPDGTVILTALDKMQNKEYLLCQKQLSNGAVAEIRVNVTLIENSAAVAGRFMLIITAVCFSIGLVWIFFFARKFSRPISRMTKVTDSLSRLDFSSRAEYSGTDEIETLASSINRMADSLNSTLAELKCANLKLKDEIELERGLDKMRKQFVANVSHELKTPISIIGGYAEGLKLDVSSEKREQYCDVILDESRRMNELVLSILELSRYESGQMPTQLTAIAPADIAEVLLHRLKDGRDVTAENLIPKDLKIMADQKGATSAITAFIENAFSHVNEGGIIRVFASDLGEYVKISVFNTGKPIEKEQMPLIWQSFYRGNSSHTREGNRVGLGLSIVAAVAKMHGTKCGVNNLDLGVEFFITFKKSD